MALPQSLLDAAARTAGDDEIAYIGVWDASGITSADPASVTIRPLLNASPGVCVVCVSRGDTRVLRPFIWTEELTSEAAALANAMYELGITENLLDAAAALTNGGV